MVKHSPQIPASEEKATTTTTTTTTNTDKVQLGSGRQLFICSYICQYRSMICQTYCTPLGNICSRQTYTLHASRCRAFLFLFLFCNPPADCPTVPWPHASSLFEIAQPSVEATGVCDSLMHEKHHQDKRGRLVYTAQVVTFLTLF